MTYSTIIFLLSACNPSPLTIEKCSHTSEMGGVQTAGGGMINWQTQLSLRTKKTVTIDSLLISGKVYSLTDPTSIKPGNYTLTFGYNGEVNFQPDTFQTSLGAQNVWLVKTGFRYNYPDAATVFYQANKNSKVASRAAFDDFEEVAHP